MNDQPNSSEFKFKSFGATPPQPSGFTRFVPHLRSLAAGSALATLGFFVLQRTLPDGWRRQTSSATQPVWRSGTRSSRNQPPSLSLSAASLMQPRRPK